MDKPLSFLVDHTHLQAGLYLSRVDSLDDVGKYKAVTLDLRFVSRKSLSLSNSVLDTLPDWFVSEFGTDLEAFVSGIHSVEHVFATLLRTGLVEGSLPAGSHLLYVGPGGCMTMWYLVLKLPETYLSDFIEDNHPSVLCSSFIKLLIHDSVEYIRNNGVPGSDARSCGNPELHNKDVAIFILNHYLNEVWEYEYPTGEENA